MHATIMPLSSNYSPKGEPHASYLNQNPTEIISFLKDKRLMKSEIHTQLNCSHVFLIEKRCIQHMLEA